MNRRESIRRVGLLAIMSFMILLSVDVACGQSPLRKAHKAYINSHHKKAIHFARKAYADKNSKYACFILSYEFCVTGKLDSARILAKRIRRKNQLRNDVTFDDWQNNAMKVIAQYNPNNPYSEKLLGRVRMGSLTLSRNEETVDLEKRAIIDSFERIKKTEQEDVDLLLLIEPSINTPEAFNAMILEMSGEGGDIISISWTDTSRCKPSEYASGGYSYFYNQWSFGDTAYAYDVVGDYSDTESDYEYDGDYDDDEDNSQEYSDLSFDDNTGQLLAADCYKHYDSYIYPELYNYPELLYPQIAAVYSEFLAGNLDTSNYYVARYELYELNIETFVEQIFPKVYENREQLEIYWNEFDDY